MDVDSALIAIGLFVVGAGLAIWATEKLLEGLVGLATLTALSTFVMGARSGHRARANPARA